MRISAIAPIDVKGSANSSPLSSWEVAHLKLPDTAID